MIVDPTIPARPDDQPGRHHIQRGATCPETGRVVGRTPAQFKAKAIIRRNEGDLKPRTRRAR